MELAGIQIQPPPGLIHLAEGCRYEQGHTWQVMRLAVALFDELQGLHHMPPLSRRILAEGALLHDIGWCRGGKGHHKSAYLIATGAAPADVAPEEVELAAQVGRYHRKAPPSLDHPPFARLSPPDRKTILKLSAILRVADGLDRGHRSVVSALRCDVGPEEITIHLECWDSAGLEVWGATRKSGLFREVFKRGLAFTVQPRAQ